MQGNVEKYLDLLLMKANSLEVKNDTKSREYIIKNYQDLLSPDALRKVETAILFPNDDSVTKEYLLSRLLQNYVYYNYDENENFIRFLETNNMATIIYTIENNERMMHDLIISYYTSFKSKPQTLESKVFDLIEKLEVKYRVVFINDMLRENYEILYNTLLYNANDSLGACKLIDEAIYGNIAIKGDEHIENIIKFLRDYRIFLPKLIYSDIYEDLSAQKVEYDFDKPAVRIIAKAIADKDYSLPEDYEERRLLFNYFAYLCTCKEQRLANRKKISAAKEGVLKSINPLWGLDEGSIINKR